ncbi:hypothetical protein AVDCRST_MAG94-5015 [uncultured Leptolyngbya sp.]|uniref:Uncharacterized protein n=1 Tax=uncultured Leptolyngbya sp. TaxID=332963 RepID=A0A6J4NBX1_9CYAN|nr:hypothetical protein AVDCRST_MAG94-5015 [uncultured Leptolyngbya sp.]
MVGPKSQHLQQQRETPQGVPPMSKTKEVRESYGHGVQKH